MVSLVDTTRVSFFFIFYSRFYFFDDYLFTLILASIHSAYCRNPTDGAWYLFDDAHVSRVKQSEIVTTAAYILFYQRRNLPSSSSCASSSSSSSSSSSASSTSGSDYPSSGSDHWAFRLPRDTNRNRNTNVLLLSQPAAVNLGGTQLTTNGRKEDEMTTTMERNTTALLARSEDDGSGEWSDEDADAAVALNGDWVKRH